MSAAERYDTSEGDNGKYGIDVISSAGLIALLYEPEFSWEDVDKMCRFMNRYGYRTFDELCESIPSLLRVP